MKILMLLFGRDFPPDIRVEKEARALISGGHDVTVLCEWRTSRLRTEMCGGVRVVRVAQPSLLTAPLVKSREMIFHRSRRWEKEIARVIRECAIDVLHVHDLPMLAIGLELGRAAGIPVIADLHENFPAMVRIPTGSDDSVRKVLLSWAQRLALWGRFERQHVGCADHVLVVVEEARERLWRMGVPENKVSVIRNTVDIQWIENTPLKPEIVDSYEDEYVITYIGGFSGAHRGLETVLEAMPTTISRVPEARLLLVGRGSMEKMLRRRAEELGVASRVSFVGWQPIEAVPSFIASSQVCLVPHASFEHTETTMPHKLFQYMAMGKPVVVSSCRPLRRVVEETGSGLVFDAGDAQSLSEALVVLSDESLRESLGEAGGIAARGGYSWAEDAAELRSLYDRIAVS